MHVLVSVFGDLTQSRLINSQIAAGATSLAGARDLYVLLRSYYLNNALYESLKRVLVESGSKEIDTVSIRNPAFRVVEFYVSHVWQGALPDAIEIDKKSVKSQTLIDDVYRVWDWCNWNAKKDVAVRWCATYGDLIIKVFTDSADPRHRGPDHVGFQLITPETVTTIKHDALHDDVVYIRIDTPVESTDSQTNVPMFKKYVTEVWDLESNRHMQWRHTFTPETPVDRLGDPEINVDIFEKYGIDFVPFVHVKFRDIGEERGVGSYTLQLDKIDEANRMATRLHRVIYQYNRVTHALRSNMVDKDGRPVPPPQIGKRGRSSEDDDGVVTLGGEKFLRLPGNASLDLLVPQLDYTSHLAALNSHMDEMAQDLPEMEFYRLRENADISARAVWYKMSPAIKRVEAVLGVINNGLIKANKMALIIGSNIGAFESKYGSGSESLRDPNLDHRFVKQPILRLSAIDELEIERGKIEITGAKRAAGLDQRTVLEEMGYDDVEGIIERKKQELIDMQTAFGSMDGRAPTREQRENQNGRPSNVRGFEG